MPPRPMPSVPVPRQQSDNQPSPLSVPVTRATTEAIVTSPTQLASRAYSLSLESDFVAGGTLDWPFDLTDTCAPDAQNEIFPHANASGPPAYESVPEPHDSVKDRKTHSTAEDHGDRPESGSRQIAYQYALRYAILLDADNAQLAARPQPGSGRNGPTIGPSLSRTGSETGGFSVKTIGKASGTSNINNRTPTLISKQDADRPRTGNRLRSKSWKSSIMEFGGSAARKVKAEINNTKLRGLDKSGKSSKTAKSGALTPAIIKALVQQLKTATNAPSLHPLTQACYMEMYNYLRVRETGETIGEHGTIDDILELFSDLSRVICGQHGITNSEDVSRTVESQMSRFVKLLRAMLQSKVQTSREAGLALLKLDDYPDTLVVGSSLPVAAQSGIPSPRSSTYEPSGSMTADDDSDKPAKLVTIWLKRAFNVPDSDHQQCLLDLRKEVNQETAIQDLRMCLLVLKRDQSFAGKPDNFRTYQAYRVWKDREITLLEQLIHTYAMRQSYMSGEQIGVGRIKLEASAVEAMGDEELAEAFEYIPSRATLHYRELVHTAVAHDIVDKLRPGTPDTVIPLSTAARELLNQLAIAWRISGPYREICYLDAINNRYVRGDLPITYLLDAYGKIERIVHLINPQEWHTAQYEYLLEIQSDIEFRALGNVKDIIEELDHQRPEKSTNLKRLLRILIINDVNAPAALNKPMPNIAGRRNDVMETLEPSIVYRCDCMMRQCFTDDISPSSQIDGYAQLAVLILSDYERCSKIFADALFEDGDRRFDVTGIVAQVEAEYFYTSFKRHVDQFGYKTDSADIEVGLELCKSITKIEELHGRYSEQKLEGIDSRRLFKATASTWLDNIDREKYQWADNALKQDSTSRELDIGKHSTSVIDLVSCFSQQATKVQRLEWPDVEMRAWFLTEFMKFVGQCFDVYAKVMMRQFLACLSPAEATATEADEPQSPVWNSMWNSRKYKEQSLSLSATTLAALTMLDQSQSTQVSAEACIKLNNLSVAQEKLYELQDDLDIRATVEALGGADRPSLRNHNLEKFLLLFKVIRAESLDLARKQTNIGRKGSQPYVKLAVTRPAENGVTKRQTFAKTRPAPDGAVNPRWNESFDLAIGSKEEFMTLLEARICTRDGPKHLGFKEKTRGRAFFAPPAKLTLGVDSSVDVVLDLEPAGHLLLQVTIDGECDDVEFYSGRMFRILSRTQSDMQQRIVEHVAVGIREYLRQILVSQPIRYRSSRMSAGHLSIDRGIERSIQFLKRNGHQEPASIRVTQESCCEALIPLIDYLEDNLHILFVHLYDNVANGVLTKVWYEVLTALEDIILPPLRGQSKGNAKPMTETDLTNVFDCLDFLKWYFGGGDDKDGMSEEVLESRKYRELIEVRGMYFMMTKELIDEYMREMRSSATRASEATGTEGLEPSQSPNVVEDPALPPALPPRPWSPAPRAERRFSGPSIAADNSSSETLPLSPHHDMRAAIIPATKSKLSRNRSVWAHKDAATLSRFKRDHRMVTDKGELILRLLRLRFDKDAAKFVLTQMDLRNQQMQFEMRRAVLKHP
ncbi:hypothetical protein LPJ77_000616 [Coemansia sp. RSA 2523]|nr:hypothetical protein LPJ54_000283 [Coemansia sp. RSA 1824]KAJ1810786.1 hypothetical protein LPJ77_000616 [Coemansia sp. RSA 2523]KAJ2429877.1 hypothetical protein GGF47_000431 [Coemansia sp. RSA 2524]